MKLRTKLWRMLPFCWSYTDCRWGDTYSEWTVYYINIPLKGKVEVFETLLLRKEY